jgi:hypothetical protein
MALDISGVIRGRLDGKTNFAMYDFPVASGVVVTAGDFVYFTGGRISSNSIGGALLAGMVLETKTGNAGGSVKAKTVIDPWMTYLLDNDNLGTTFDATHVGTKFDLIGATGAQLVDTSSTGTSGQLVCLEYNPQIDPVKGDTSYGLFMIQEGVFVSGSGAQ